MFAANQDEFQKSEDLFGGFRTRQAGTHCLNYCQMPYVHVGQSATSPLLPFENFPDLVVQDQDYLDQERFAARRIFEDARSSADNAHALDGLVLGPGTNNAIIDWFDDLQMTDTYFPTSTIPSGLEDNGVADDMADHLDFQVAVDRADISLLSESHYGKHIPRLQLPNNWFDFGEIRRPSSEGRSGFQEPREAHTEDDSRRKTRKAKLTLKAEIRMTTPESFKHAQPKPKLTRSKAQTRNRQLVSDKGGACDECRATKRQVSILRDFEKSVTNRTAV